MLRDWEMNVVGDEAARRAERRKSCLFVVSTSQNLAIAAIGRDSLHDCG